jgi:hypothetical protein
MKRILVICPLTRDKRELALLDHSHKMIFHHFSLDDSPDRAALADEEITNQIDLLTQFIRENNIGGLMSTTDDLGVLLKAIMAQKYNLPGPCPRIVAHQQHKYYARLAHQKIIPEATPAFALLHENEKCPLPFPVFVKPVRGNFSRGSQAVHSMQALVKAYQDAYACSNAHPWFNVAQPYLPDNSNSIVLVEALCVGVQCTVEGFVHDKNITMLGIIDSVMFPGTISFKQFDYPSQLSPSVQQRILAIAYRLVEGLGFDNGCFNIECMYNPNEDTIHVIEMNPRLASQFADLYEKVDGFNSYEILLAIATGQMPQITFKKGKFSHAASCVLRVFQDHLIVKMPKENVLHTIYSTYPEARIELFGKEGQKLSELCQDGKSFRYGLIHVGGQSQANIQSKCAHIQDLLAIELTPI